MYSFGKTTKRLVSFLCNNLYFIVVELDYKQYPISQIVSYEHRLW